MRPATLWIGGVALAAGLIGCVRNLTPVEPRPGERIKAEDELARRVASDPVAVLQEGLDRYHRSVTSYACTLYQQERVNPQGPMGPVQKMLCKFMDDPFSIYFHTVENPIGVRRALYVQGKWGDRMLVRPSGLGALFGCLLIDPHGSRARAGALRSIDQFGFRRNIEYIIGSYATARRDAILTQRLLGIGAVDGRNVVIFEVQITEPKPTGRFDFPHIRVSIDCEWLLPTAIDTWDAEDIERGHYRYVDVNFKANLTAKDFLPEANGMTSPSDPEPAAAQPAGGQE